MPQDNWPIEIRLAADKRRLALTFDDGLRGEVPAELLRVESPSAEVQGHAASQKRLVAGKRGVAIVAVEPVGNYAVRLVFDDGHDTGIFTWPYLHDLAARTDEMMRNYAARLAEKGLSRDARA